MAASSSAFANENRESVSDLIFLCLFDFEFEFEFDDVSQILVLVKVCDRWRWQCRRLCGSDFRRT